MPLNIDTYPHPQLRYTVRLRYICPIYGEQITDYVFMSEEEHEDEKSFQRIMEDKMRELNTIVYDGDEKIDEWASIDEKKNTFYDSEIFSDAVLSLLKDGKESYSVCDDEERRDLALAYLSEIKPLYTKEQVAQAILSVIDVKPNVDIVNRILKVWGATLNRNTYVEMQLKMIVNSNEMDLALGKLLRENNAENLRILKGKLNRLNEEWNLTQEEDVHRRAILVYRFLTECPLLQRNKMSLKKGMDTLSSYLNVPSSNYTKEVQLCEPKKDRYGKYDTTSDPMVSRKVRIYTQINSRWATFKARHFK